MAETKYRYDKTPYNLGQLDAEVRAAAPPLPGFLGVNGGEGVVEAIFADALSPADESRLEALVVAHTPAVPRRPRNLWDVGVQLNALTAADKVAVWDWFTGVSPAANPPPWRAEFYPNASDVFTNFGLATETGLTGTPQLRSQIRAVTFYLIDHPRALVNPTWRPSLNVPGDEEVP